MHARQDVDALRQRHAEEAAALRAKQDEEQQAATRLQSHAALPA